MRSSYKMDDVILLLKDITGKVAPQSTDEREKEIQSGRHYSEMLPVEYVPSEKYMLSYQNALVNYSKVVADAVAILSDKIFAEKGDSITLVSLARAGTPIGILLKRYLKFKYDIDSPHYSISIIRGRGIDKNAMKYILDRHSAKSIVFVDGWIGKGAILRQLEESLAEYQDVSPELAVLADPANVTRFFGTQSDILIPNACLNSTVSGLISRTFLRDDIIGRDDFHGAVYYGELQEVDLTYDFIDTIVSHFDKNVESTENIVASTGIEEVEQIAQDFGISDINFVKPGIGEATRVLLRRVPYKILIAESAKNEKTLNHIIQLADEKNVPVEYYPLKNYKVCGIIKNLGDV